MTKAKMILIASFLVVFAAGTSLGVLIAGRMRPPPPPPGSRLAHQLKLSAEQQDQMHKIWEEVMGSVFSQRGERREALGQERDQAILGLLSEAQRAQYDAIQQEYRRKVDELSQERKRAFDEAVERTKKILTPEQAAKYDELMKEQGERGMGRGGPGDFRGPRRRHSASASRPVTSEPAAPHGEE